MRQQKGVDAMAEGAIRWLFLQLEGGEGVRRDQFDVEPRRGWRRLDEIAVMDGGAAPRMEKRKRKGMRKGQSASRRPDSHGGEETVKGDARRI